MINACGCTLNFGPSRTDGGIARVSYPEFGSRLSFFRTDPVYNTVIGPTDPTMYVTESFQETAHDHQIGDAYRVESLGISRWPAT